MLAGECERIALMGLSYGAEAALLTASVDDRVDAVVALAPTDVAWEGQHEHDDDPRRSKWTLDGQPVALGRSPLHEPTTCAVATRAPALRR